MATLAPPLHSAPRTSTETERRHLLTESTAPSSAASFISHTTEADGDRTPRAHSPAPSSQPRRGTLADPSPTPRPYKGFPSEAAYLAALREWAESKKYLEPLYVVHGFYGNKTMEEYAAEPGMELGLRKKWKARKARKAEKVAEQQQTQRRNTVS